MMLSNSSGYLNVLGSVASADNDCDAVHLTSVWRKGTRVDEFSEAQVPHNRIGMSHLIV